MAKIANQSVLMYYIRPWPGISFHRAPTVKQEVSRNREREKKADKGRRHQIKKLSSRAGDQYSAARVLFCY